MRPATPKCSSGGLGRGRFPALQQWPGRGPSGCEKEEVKTSAATRLIGCLRDCVGRFLKLPVCAFCVSCSFPFCARLSWSGATHGGLSTAAIREPIPVTVGGGHRSLFPVFCQIAPALPACCARAADPPRGASCSAAWLKDRAEWARVRRTLPQANHVGL